MVKYKRWSKEEDQMLAYYYPTMHLEDTAKLIGRSYWATKNRVKHLKINQKKAFTRYIRSLEARLKPKKPPKPIGSLSFDEKRGWWMVKIGNQDWQRRALVEWRKAYGEIPSDKMLVRVSGDVRDDDLKHFRVIPRAGLLQKKSVFRKRGDSLKRHHKWKKLKEAYAFKF